MLFHITQAHDPGTCPQQDGLPPEILFDQVPDVKVHHSVADVPGHKLFFLVETDSYDALQAFLEPGRTRCTTHIAPVTRVGTD